MNDFLLRHKAQIIFFFVALVIFTLRRPDAILNAQFWAEDGLHWFQNAYDHSYSVVTIAFPAAGYLYLYPRIIALLSGLLPLSLTPLVFNIFALAAQSLPLVYLWSRRTNYMSTTMKWYLSIVYLLLPYTAEIHGNLTNTQWFGAVTLFLLVFIKESPKLLVKITDVVLIVLMSLTGPFAAVISPILVFESWRRKQLPKKYVVVFICAFIQVLFILLSRPESTKAIGFSITQLLNIIGGQVFGAGLFGYQSMELFMQKPWINPVLAVLGIEMVIYVFLRSKKVVKYFLVFATIAFLGALLSPLRDTSSMTYWEILALPESGGRYYFLPHLAVFVCLGWLVFCQKKVILRVAAALVLLGALSIGVPRDFMHTPYKDFHYQDHIREFRESPGGTSKNIPVNPGHPWSIQLTK